MAPFHHNIVYPCLQDEEDGSDKDSDGKSKPLILLWLSIPVTVKWSIRTFLFHFLIDALSAESDDESLSSSSEGSSSSESSSSSSSEDEEEGERPDSVDSMDESTMDSTTDRYGVLIGSGVFIPALFQS